MGSRKLIVSVGLCALAAVMMTPAAAHAVATATFGAGTLTVTGDAGAETFTVNDVLADVRVTASSGGLTDPDGAGAVCEAVSANIVECLNLQTTMVIVNGEAGGDTINYTRTQSEGDGFTASGGADNDRLDTTGSDTGDFGAIVLTAGAGSDTVVNTRVASVNGGDGDDLITIAGSGGGNILAGNGNDTISNSGDGMINGEGGNDLVHGLDGIVNGGDGNDTLTADAFGFSGDTGGPGNDALNGNDRAYDFFVGEPGADTYTGGSFPRPPQMPVGDEFPQFGDRISYAGDTPVTVTLDNVANDGTAGEGDNVKSDVENINGSNGNDTLDASGAPEAEHELAGGRGDDTLVGGARDDSLNGGNGSDNLSGGAGDDGIDDSESIDPMDPPTDQAGNDTLNGGEGNDDFDASSTHVTTPGGVIQFGVLGTNTYVGGPGEDFIYVARTTVTPRTPDASDPSSTLETPEPMSVSLDGVANDGGGGITFNAPVDIEDVSTGEGADTIVGSSGANVLAGGSGNDTIDGLGGVDLIFGNNGVDTITSRDQGFDKVNCGLAVDATVQGDAGDDLQSCEASALTPLPPPPDTTKPTLRLSGATAIKVRTLLRTRTISVRARPSEAAILQGELFTGARAGVAGQMLLGRARLGLRAGTRTLKVKLSRARAQQLARLARSRRYRARGFAVNITVVATDAAGLSAKRTRTLRIKR